MLHNIHTTTIRILQIKILAICLLLFLFVFLLGVPFKLASRQAPRAWFSLLKSELMREKKEEVILSTPLLSFNLSTGSQSNKEFSTKRALLRLTSVTVFNFTHPPVLSALLLIISASTLLVPVVPLFVPAPFLSSAPLPSRMTFHTPCICVPKFSAGASRYSEAQPEQAEANHRSR